MTACSLPVPRGRYGHWLLAPPVSLALLFSLTGACAGDFDTVYLAALDTVVGQITAVNMTAVLDPHNYARYRKGQVTEPRQYPLSEYSHFPACIHTACSHTHVD